MTERATESRHAQNSRLPVVLPRSQCRPSRCMCILRSHCRAVEGNRLSQCIPRGQRSSHHRELRRNKCCHQDTQGCGYPQSSLTDVPWGRAQPLGGLGSTVCPPQPILPWSQHKIQASYDSTAGQQEGEAGLGESLRRVSLEE